MFKSSRIFLLGLVTTALLPLPMLGQEAETQVEVVPPRLVLLIAIDQFLEAPMGIQPTHGHLLRRMIETTCVELTGQDIAAIA